MNRIPLSLLTLLLCLIAPTLCKAENFWLKIADTKDQTRLIAVDSQLKVHVENDALVITNPDDRLQLELSDLKTFSYVRQNQSGLNEMPADECFEITESSITFTSSKEAGAYAVYRIDGTTVAKGFFSKTLTISFASLQAGTYILKIDGVAPIKFAVK